MYSSEPICFLKMYSSEPICFLNRSHNCATPCADHIAQFSATPCADHIAKIINKITEALKYTPPRGAPDTPVQLCVASAPPFLCEGKNKAKGSGNPENHISQPTDLFWAAPSARAPLPWEWLSLFFRFVPPFLIFKVLKCRLKRRAVGARSAAPNFVSANF